MDADASDFFLTLNYQVRQLPTEPQNSRHYFMYITYCFTEVIFFNF